MAKTARWPIKGKAKSTKPKTRRAGKPVKSAKPVAGPKAKSRRASKVTTRKSTKPRPRGTTRAKNPSSRPVAKTPAKRFSARSRAGEPAGYVATLDGWCKDCTAKLQKLFREYSSPTRPRTKSRRAQKQEHMPEWLASGARQLGLGLRRGARLADPRKLIKGTGEKIRHVQFNRVTDFCKKEWSELSALAAKINNAANPPRPRPTRRRKK